MALFGHGAMSELSPFSVVERKLDFGAVRASFDPGTDIVDNSQIDAIAFCSKVPFGKETHGTSDAGNFVS